MDFSTLPAASRILMPGSRGLIVENRNAFLSRYPSASPFILAEWAGGNLRNEGETLTLTSGPGGTLVRTLTWTSSSPWPPLAGYPRIEPGGPDFSIVLNSPNANPDHALPQNWRSSGISRGNPGAADSTTPPPDATTDSDGNGYSDFAEWAMGPGRFPSAGPEIHTPPGGSPDTYLMLRVPRSGSADATTFTAEASRDLSAWSAAGITDLGLESDGLSEFRVFRSSQPVGSESRFYLRARIQRQ
jgi:hypothetical protein